MKRRNYNIASYQSLGFTPNRKFRLEAQTGRFDAVVAGDPHRAALKLLANLTQREALVLAYNDLLLLLGALFVFGLILLPLVRRPRSFFGH